MKKTRRILGCISLALGGASIVVGLSPLFPIFAEAFLIGGAFIAGGTWALAGPEITGAFRRLKLANTPEAGRRPGSAIDPLLPVRILKLAREKAGILTVSEVAIGLNIPIELAEEGLRACVRSGNAMASFEVALGYSQYRFPEFLTPEERKALLG
jgi:hypothetical protein